MDIVETLNQPLSMSQFRNSGDLYAEMTLQRKLAADTITALRARCASLEAERDSARETIRMHKVWDFPKDIQDLSVKLERAEAMCADLAKALEIIAGEEPCHAHQIARNSLAAYRK